MNVQSSNAYHLDGRFTDSQGNDFHGVGSSVSQWSNQPGLTPGAFISTEIHQHHHPTSPSIMYKLTPSEEVKKRLLQGHLSYLNREDTPEKLAYKTKLEGLIVEYLSMVPHEKKFENLEVAECFDKSIIENKDFCASKAASAFEVLEKYSTFLLTKPWRKEFRTIYPFGGYLKGLVDKQLRGATKIFYLMGYRNKNANGVNVYSVESSIIDPDTLTRVSLDCLIAFVECQMMIQIADALKSKHFSLSWLQILDLRANSICSMDQLVNYVLDSDRLIDFENDLSANIHSSSSKHGKQSHQPNYQQQLHPHPQILGQDKHSPGQYQQQSQPHPHHSSQPQQTLQYHQNGNPVFREARTRNDAPYSKELTNHLNLDSPRVRDLIHFTIDEPMGSNVIYHGIHTPTGYIAPPSMFASELVHPENREPYSSHHYPQHQQPPLPPNSHQYHYSQQLAQQPQHQQYSHPPPPHPHQPQQQHLPAQSSTSVITLPSTKPSYKGLNQINDIDIIDSALSTITIRPTDSRQKHMDPSTPINTVTSPGPSSRTKAPSITSPGNSEITRSDESCQLPVKSSAKLNHHNHSNKSSNVGYELSNNNSSTSPTINNNVASRKLDDHINAIIKSFSDEERGIKSSLPVSSSPRASKTKERALLLEKRAEPMDSHSSRTRENRLERSNQPVASTANVNIPPINHNTNDGAWSCAYCTFLNANSIDVCDMCSRSREKPAVNPSLVSGGRVCPLCTLVNSRDANLCNACEHSLLNSPTYI